MSTVAYQSRNIQANPFPAAPSLLFPHHRSWAAQPCGTCWWEIQTTQAMLFSHIHTNPSFQRTLQTSIFDLLPKGQLSEDEEHHKYLVHDEGNNCTAVLE